MMIRVIRFLLPFFLCFFTVSLFGDEEPIFWQEGDEDLLLDRLLGTMSDQEILGQVFLLGYAGTSPSPEILKWIRTRNIGGVKIFGWNVKNLSELTRSISSMQSAASETRNGIPLLIATDQEGGWVRHVKGNTSITPGNLAIGASGLAYDAYYTGYFIGMELRTLGINMNFAPTVDIYTNPDADVIGPRAFSSDPLQTSLLSVAYYRGMEQAGIICTAKHYPGHGDADLDSHVVLPEIAIDLEQLWERELLPYRFLIREGLPAIMSGHLSFPNITGSSLPASLSPYFQTDLLRKRMGFQGIVITDDLRMRGAWIDGLDLADICEKALEAGNDMIMLSRTPELNDIIWQKLYDRYTSDDQFRKRIVISVRRILKTKLTFLKSRGSISLFPDAGAPDREIPSPEGKEFFFDAACRSVTLIRGDSIPVPSQRKKERILLAGQFNSFLKQGKQRFPDADTYYFSYTPFYSARPAELEKFRSIISRYDLVILCLANPNSLAMLKTLENSKTEVIVFSVLTPVYLREVPWVRSALAVYGTGTESFAAGFAVLDGDFTPEGSLPITFFKGGP